MFVSETQFRVRYGETDQMGYVYYGNYAEYFEVGRVEAIRSLGMTYRGMEEELGVMMPVKSLSIKYLRPVYYDDLITIKTMITALPDRNITFHSEIFNQEGVLTTGATVILSFVDIKLKETTTIPLPLLERLKAFFEKTE